MYESNVEYTENILFVDDEPNVISSLRRGLLTEPYNKYYAVTAKEALEVMEKTEIHVLVTDMRMPLVSGLDLLKVVEEKYPLVVKIVLSGYAHLPQVLATINQVSLFRFIQKPWNLEDEFKPMLRDALARAAKIRSSTPVSITNDTQLLECQQALDDREAKHRLALSRYEALLRIQQEMLHQVIEGLQLPEFHADSTVITSRLLALEEHLATIKSAFMAEEVSESSDMLRQSITRLVQGNPVAIKPVAVKISNARLDPEAPLRGPFRLYIALQSFIIQHLLVKPPGLEEISIGYDLQTQLLSITYRCEPQTLTPSPWEQHYLQKLLDRSHDLISGSFSTTQLSNEVLVISTIRVQME